MALTRVQSTGRVSAPSATSVSLTFATPPTIGNAIVVMVNTFAGSPVGSTCVDNRGHTYQQANGLVNGQVTSAIFFLPIITASSAPFTVTVTYIGTVYYETSAFEVAGVGAAPGLVLDKTISTAGASSTNVSTGTTAALTANEVLAVAVHAINGNQTSITVQVVSPTWTQEFENLNHSATVAGEADSRVLTGVLGTTQTCSWTESAAAISAAVLAVFKSSATTPVIPPTPYQSRILADGASAYWPLDDAVGSTTARDLVGTYPMTIPGTGVTLDQPGAGSGRAMRFDGANNLTRSTLPSLYPQATLEAWVQLTTIPSTSVILGAAITGPGDFYWSREIGGGGTWSLVYSSGTAAFVKAVALTQWIYLALSLNGTTATLYVDGVVQGTQPLTLGAAAGIATPRTIGLAWFGLLQDVAIYPRALTATEVAQHYALRLAPDTPAGPTAIVSALNVRGRTDKQGGLIASLGSVTGTISPPTAFRSARVQADSDGVLRLAVVSNGSSVGPRVALENARVKTDATGAILVAYTNGALGTLEPRVPLRSARVRIDNQGALVVYATSQGSRDPIVALGNARVRTDVNGTLVVC